MCQFIMKEVGRLCIYKKRVTMYYANILTGSIGCGKSTTARLLELHGFKIIDADIIARKALEAAKSSVVAAFGDEILESSDCYAMRKQISSIDSKATILTSSQNGVFLENKKNLDSRITCRTKPLSEISSIESKSDFSLNTQNDNILNSTTNLDKDISSFLKERYHRKQNLESSIKAITISREKLGNIVFNNAEKKAKLESILHPLIQQHITQECEILEKKKSPYFIDIPLYFESKYEYKKRFVICVYATRDMQIQRIQARNNLSLEDAIKRVDSQIDIEIKRSKSDFVIENTSDLKTLQKNIESFLQTFLSQY